MSFNRLNISDLIEQQLPDFISEEFSVFVKFFSEYYKSLEIKGSTLDISNNILQYLDLDSLTKSNLVKSAVLDIDINSTTSSIKLDSLYGFEKTNGIVSIDNEIIFYQDVDIATNTLLNCQRGYSATTELKQIGTTVTSSTAAAHTKGAVVNNLSNLFLFSIIKNYEEQYLEGFPYTQIDSDIDVVTLIKNIKDFYASKGTSLSIEFLFRCIFDEEIIVKYPRDYVIKSSYSDWTVDDIIKVESISGNPYDLIGNEIKQTDVSGQSQISAIVDTILVNNITNYPSGNKDIYEIRLNILNRSNFKVPSSTILRRELSSTDNTITVDSTIGFPETNGIIQINDEIITYRYKSFNQFFDCVRGSYNSSSASHANLSLVTTTEYLYGYSSGIDDPINLVKMRLIGILSSSTIVDGSSYYNDIDPVELSKDGVSDARSQFTSWVINEDGNLSSSSNTEINNNIKNLSTEVTAVYKTDNYAYVASTGLPNYPIGPFRGISQNNVSNQFILKSIPLDTEKITQTQPVGNRGIGLFVNGVEAFSCQDLNYETFGNITSVDVINNGYGFEDNIQPVFRISNNTGSGATFSANIANGKILSVNVLTGGSNYTSDSEIEIAYGFDATASVVNTGDIVRGSIRTITVTNGGNNYIVAPNVIITDTTGRGKGAFARANISNGQVVSIDVLSGGIDYSDKNNIIIKLVSKGSGVVANVVTKKWNYDRVFRLNYDQDDTTKQWSLSPSKKVDSGNGYLFPSNNAAYGLEYAYSFNPKILRNNLNDNVNGSGSDYSEIFSGFTHSPIIGWAYDGNPIYGAYGYSDPLDNSSSIKRIVSSYRLITTVPSNRPSISLYPLGAFIEDYEFVNGLGDLDPSNGRFCETPEFPNGRYCYFITVDAFGKGVFPYIVGKTYNSVVQKNNILTTFNQVEYNLPETAKRIRTSKTPNTGYDARLLVNSVERGSIDSYGIGNSDSLFKVGDYLFIDSTNTEGAGALASIEAVNGVHVNSVTYAVASGYTASGVTISGGLSQFAFPTKVTYQNGVIPYEAFVTTSTPHLLSNNDIIYLNIDRSVLQTTKTFKVRSSAYQIVKYNKPSFNTTLDANVSFDQNTINVISSSGFRNNDYIIINDEILKIVSINYTNNQITVLRSQFNTPLRLHTISNKVSLYVPDDQPDYRFEVGDSLNSSGVSGVIYNVDKVNSSIEIRILSGTLTSSSVINDSSTTLPRPVSISSVTTKKTYWEIDPTNTGNYYVRDLNFEMVRGTKYIFDISDSSNLGYNLIFSEDSSNINEITSLIRVGTPGLPGAVINFSNEILNDTLISRVYYFEQNNLIQNNKTYFTVADSYIENSHVIKIVDNYTFKYSLLGQPEKTNYSNTSYYTYSASAIGNIVKIKNIDGGGGYKKLPLVRGIVHTELDNAKFDNAKFAYGLTGGVLQDSIKILFPGNRYSNKTTLQFVSETGSGAILIPTIINGQIQSVSVADGGKNYTNNDKIIAIDTAAEIFPVSDSIGKVKSIRYSNYGTQFNPDRTLSKELSLYYKLIITNLTGEIYKNFEYLTTSNGATLQTVSSQKIGVNSYLLEVKLIDGILVSGSVITGTIISTTTSKIYEVKNAKIYGNISGYIKRSGFFDSDIGKLSSSSQKLTDSYYYQDFSYVIRSTKSLKDYKSKIDKTVHPLGFKLFGEVAIEGSDSITNSGLTGTGSVTLPVDYSDNRVVIISASGLTVESSINYRRYEVQTINTRTPSTIQGEGAASLNFLENQIDAVRIDDISDYFDSSITQFNLSSSDGNFPSDTKNTSIILSLNEIFQEPIERKNISSISYVDNIATITTVGNHGYAYTESGVTYPTDQYIHIEGVTYSGYDINFNDKFEIYSVNSSNTFKVLFDNPNGYLTNNDPAVCADVQSTIDNLVGILTTAITAPSGIVVPQVNTGIWTTSGVSSIVSANKHRDAGNLITLNKQEIIDRAAAEIALQYPDFYYPNEPQTTAKSRYRDSYRLIQQNKQEIIDGAFAVISGFTGNPNPVKCKRDIGYFVDAVSLDLITGGNRYSIEFLKQYFVANGTSLTSSLQGEVPESISAFNAARDLMKSAITNQLTIKDLTLTPDPTPASGVVSNINPTSCSNVRTNIDNLSGIVSFYLNQGSLNYPTALPLISSGTTTSGETICKRDIGYIVDAVVSDMFVGGNQNIINAAKAYYTTSGTTLITNGLYGEVPQSVVAFNKARDVMKLAITNQLYGKDFTLLPDFLGTSGSVSPTGLLNAKLVKGQFEYKNNSIKLFESPKEGTVFYSSFFRFLNGSDNERFSYKLSNIIFDGLTTSFNLYKSDGSNVTTLNDENLLIFIDGVLQTYGESYTIDRGSNPNKIVFSSAYEKERQFFGYTFSKYKVLNDISSQFNEKNTIFDLKYLEENIKIPDVDQLLVLIDGVPQYYNNSYTINDNLLIFNEAPQSGKKCQLLYFYGKIFEKTITVWNGNPFEKINILNEVNNSVGCKTYVKYPGYDDLISPGDLIQIEGETPKELIYFNTSATKYSDNYEYSAAVYTDNTFIRGKNAVATAVVSGYPISGSNTVTISGTVAISGTTGIPTVYDYAVSRVDVNNSGTDFDVPPIVLFKTSCDNPGKGAQAYATIKNKKIESIIVTNPGSGYTSAPDVVFAKRYNIIKQKYPIKISKEIIVDSRLYDGKSAAVSLGLNVLEDRYEQYELPRISTQITTSTQNIVQIDSQTNSDPSRPALAYVLETLDTNKFTYEPKELTANLNSDEAPYLYQGMTIQSFSRYFPNLTIGDFTARAGRTTGSNETNIMNIAQDGYVVFGATLANSITSSGTTIVASGLTSLAKFPSSGYIQFGNETISYTSISGVTLLNCTRGVKSTIPVAHNQGDYFNLAWRG
jgi:hypothetical protein